MRFHTAILLGSLAFLAAPDARAADHIESVNGDLSNAFGAPTLISQNPGAGAATTTITGTTGTVIGVTDHDYFRIHIPAGFQVNRLRVVSYGGPSQSFLGLQQGTVFTSPGTTTETTLLGYVHINATSVGTNVLPAMGAAFMAQGFVGPLPTGDYSFWIQENSTPSVNYSIALDTSPVPVPTPALPAALAVILASGLFFAGMRRATRAGG